MLIVEMVTSCWMCRSVSLDTGKQALSQQYSSKPILKLFNPRASVTLHRDIRHWLPSSFPPVDEGPDIHRIASLWFLAPHLIRPRLAEIALFQWYWSGDARDEAFPAILVARPVYNTIGRWL